MIASLSTGPIESVLALNVIAHSNDFIRGILEIKCVATLSLWYKYDTTERLVTGSFKNKSIGQVNWRKGLYFVINKI